MHPGLFQQHSPAASPQGPNAGPQNLTTWSQYVADAARVTARSHRTSGTGDQAPDLAPVHAWNSVRSMAWTRSGRPWTGCAVSLSHSMPSLRMMFSEASSPTWLMLMTRSRPHRPVVDPAHDPRVRVDVRHGREVVVVPPTEQEAGGADLGHGTILPKTSASPVIGAPRATTGRRGPLPARPPPRHRLGQHRNRTEPEQGHYTDQHSPNGGRSRHHTRSVPPCASQERRLTCTCAGQAPQWSA